MSTGRELLSLRGVLARLVVALGVVLAVLIMAAAMGTIGTSRNYRDAAQIAVQRSDAANQLLVDMLDAETGYRGYVMTGNTSFLLPYSQARTRYPNDLEQLRELAADDPILSAGVVELEQIAARWFREVTQIVRMRQAGRVGEAVERINQGVAKEHIDDFRLSFTTLNEDVIAVREADLRTADTWRNRMLVTIVVVALLALGVLGASVRRLWNKVGGPIGQLALGVGRVARGRLSDPVRVHPGSVRELAQLIRGFNAMQLQVFQQRDAVAAAARREVAQRTERRLWETVQNGLLPSRLASVPGYRVVARYRPAERALLVGGDFYDTYTLSDGRLAVLVGDVTGHGATSAAQAAGLRFGWRTMVAANPTPAVVLGALNAQMARPELRSQGIFASLIYVLLSPDGRGTFVCAGHPAPLLLGRDGCREVRAHDRGPLLGVIDSPEWPEVPIHVRPGETLVLFTDGLVEAGAPEIEQFGAARACAVLFNERTAAAEARLERLVDAARRYHHGRLRDDVVVMAIERAAASPPSRRT